eukprot:gene30667-34612_t
MSQKKLDAVGNGTNLAIFQSVVVIVGVCLNPPSGGPVVEIIKAPENFCLVFGYSHDQLPMLLEELLSVANVANEKDEEDMMGAIQSGHRHKATAVVLRHAQGADLACNVEVSKGNLMKEGYKSPSSVDPDGLHRDFLTTMTIQLCCNSANVRALGMNADPSLMDPKHRAFDEDKRNQIVAEAERRIDENTQKNKEQKELKEKKPSKNHTIRGAVLAASTEPHPASAAAQVARNNSSSSLTTTRLLARSTERPLPPAVPSQPLRTEISTAETFQASITAGYYVPVPRTIAVAVPIGAEESTRRSADLPVVELEPLEEETPEGDEGVHMHTINNYDSATEQRESEAGSVENVSSIDGSETDGHHETITETEDAP